jgi:predicted O-linked N-acetylglucosamine transferase (SPINDLY family)
MPDDPTQQMLQTALRHHEAGELHQAEIIYRHILQQNPNHPAALNLLGVIALAFGQPDPAIQLIRRAIELRPDVPDFHHNLAIALQTYQRFSEAIGAWRRVMELDPGASNAPAQLGALLTLQCDYAPAIEALQRASALDPKNPGIQSNLASALALAGRVEDSIIPFRRAVELDPNTSQHHHNLAVTLRQAGLVEEAEAHFRAAIRLNPTHVNAGSGLLLTLHYRERDRAALFQEHQDWARRNTAALPAPEPHTNDRSPTRRLRVGYVSPDFRGHSVAFFIEPVLANHDPATVEVFCYSSVDRPDDVTHRLQQYVRHWRNAVGLSDDDLAALIRRDQIDILVDLAGHTAGHRLLTFARKPAPIQVTYLGYPNTTGLKQIDYRITDAIADPISPTQDSGLSTQHSFHTETLLHLNRCAWCYQPPEVAPPITPRAENPITFGSFNTLAKLTPKTLDLWAQILNNLPTAHLVLKAHGTEDPSARERILNHFSTQNINPSRITLLGRQPTQALHLEAYNQIDIALDTFPYHGTTTTCDALWMGVPVITLAGDRHVSRVGVSLLTTVGLEDLIAKTPEEYIDIATTLASDRDRLIDLRQTLRQRMKQSPLTDAPSLAREFESTFRTIFRAWCSR